MLDFILLVSRGRIFLTVSFTVKVLRSLIALILGLEEDMKWYSDCGHLEKHVISIVDRVKKQILKDKQFRNKLVGIKKIIRKS